MEMRLGTGKELVQAIASMEPCVVTHGNCSRDSLAHLQAVLQWSHAWLRMEIINGTWEYVPGNEASMEPCVVTHGNNPGKHLTNPGIECFNGAMRGYAWKCRSCGGDVVGWIGFNGAMRGYAWK